MDRDCSELWATVQSIYADYLAGDRTGIDRNLAPEVTVWDAEHHQLLRGKAELDALRDSRPVGGVKPIGLEARDPVVDVWGDVALVRHVLLVRLPAATERIRNTSVWRRQNGRWMCVHNHEDVVH